MKLSSIRVLALATLFWSALASAGQTFTWVSDSGDGAAGYITFPDFPPRPIISADQLFESDPLAFNGYFQFGMGQASFDQYGSSYDPSSKMIIGSGHALFLWNSASLNLTATEATAVINWIHGPTETLHATGHWVTSVPEPTALGMALLGFGIIRFVAMRRTSRLARAS